MKPIVYRLESRQKMKSVLINCIDKKNVEQYVLYLEENEKSENTVKKYERDILKFVKFCGTQELSKKVTMCFKENLKENYKTTSINSMLVAVNRFLAFLHREDCCVKLIKRQKRLFCDEKRELTKDEYLRMLAAARKGNDERLFLILQTICGTGIRVSELKYITRGAVQQGYAVVECKGKQRVILIPHKLQCMLKSYAVKKKITKGSVFCGADGRPLTRFVIWRAMKNICAEAQVDQRKVFPHNLRHLFARTFYGRHHDLARLADILGHSSIETTRIYIMDNAQTCYSYVAGLGLITENGRMEIHPAEVIT